MKKYIIEIHHLQYVVIILQIITATIIRKKSPEEETMKYIDNANNVKKIKKIT